ncbi:phosphodiesterase [Pseudomonas sp. NPDC087346]|uniref:phosphodiesterase n=1 Tax=Pseudomonas sp. NPDC087346 TaxID=3364438 RepID=UPI00382F3996
MEIISHRGYWLQAEEKNTPLAFERSFSLGFGTETDVRDLAGKLVISHDPPTGNEMTLDELLEIAGQNKPTLALNVKADGLADAISSTMKRHSYANWFVFDMSIPDTRAQLAAGNPTFVRMSEEEPILAFKKNAPGIWFDAFESDEWRLEALEKLLKQNIRVCIVSPELHRRDHIKFWQNLKNSGLHSNNNILLCTDLPEHAVNFFETTL